MTDQRDSDLERVVSRAREVWDDSVIEDWLDGNNAHLNGASPREMVRQGRTAEVLEAITSDEAGSFG